MGIIKPGLTLIIYNSEDIEYRDMVNIITVDNKYILGSLNLRWNFMTGDIVCFKISPETEDEYMHYCEKFIDKNLKLTVLLFVDQKSELSVETLNKFQCILRYSGKKSVTIIKNKYAQNQKYPRIKCTLSELYTKELYAFDQIGYLDDGAVYFNTIFMMSYCPRNVKESKEYRYPLDQDSLYRNITSTNLRRVANKIIEYDVPIDRSIIEF